MSEKSSRKVLMNSVIYTFSGLLQKCFSMVLLPLYTTYLTTSDYGIQSLATSFINTMSFVVSFSLFSAILRFYVDLKDDKEKLKRFYGSVSLFVFLSAVFFGVLLTILRVPLSKYVFSGADYYPVILVTLISLVFSCQHTIYGHILRSQQKAMKASVFSLIYFFTSVILNILFVVGFKLGAVGVLLATLISCLLYTLYFVIEMLAKGTIHFCFDWSLLKEALKYSIPIMPHNLSTYIAQLVSKLFISGSVSLASLGLYSVAAQFGQMSDTIQNYVNSAYGPWLYENLKAQKDGYKTLIRRTVRMIIAVIGLFFLAIALFAQDYILLFVNKAYASSWRFVPWIVTVYSIKTIYYFYVNILFYHKEASRKLFIATVSGSLVDVFLAAFLIPTLGIYGSLIAEGIAMLLRVTIVVLMSKQFENIGLRVWDFVLNFVIIMVFMLAGLSLSFFVYGDRFFIINFLYKVLIILVYCAFVFFTYRKEIHMFINRLKARRKRA